MIYYSCIYVQDSQLVCDNDSSNMLKRKMVWRLKIQKNHFIGQCVSCIIVY